MRRAHLFPAYAGVIPLQARQAHKNTTFPRIRGGDPQEIYAQGQAKDFSPQRQFKAPVAALFPAHAGVIPGVCTACTSMQPFPRIRGGDPVRGEELKDHVSLFPACAGVIRVRWVPVLVVTAFPRIRGGDPTELVRGLGHTDFSPHMRG